MFGVLNPVFLLGLTAIASPVIIHLLGRRRARVVRFSSLEFLISSLKKVARKHQLKQLLLLLLRILLFCLLAMAFARLFFHTASYDGSIKKSAVLVIDNSYSMGYETGPVSKFDEAKSKAIKVIKSLPRGSEVSVILVSERPHLLVERSTDIEMAAGKVSSIKLSNHSTDFFVLARMINGIFEQSGAREKIVYLLSDLQKIGWQFFDSKSSVRLLPGVEVKVISLGSTGIENLAVTGIEVFAGLPGAEKGAAISADLTNYGDRPAQDVILKLNIDGSIVHESEVNIEPHDSLRVVLRHVFKKAGKHTGLAGIQADDNLPIDNKYYFTVEIPEPTEVLCLGEETSGEHGSTFYLRYALNPFGEAGEGGQNSQRHWMLPVVKQADELEAKEFSDYEAIILTGLSNLSSSQVKMIEEYVSGGKGLLIFLGDGIDTSFYNNELFRDNEGLLPAELKRIITGGPGGQHHVRLCQVNYCHPVFGTFAGLEDSGLNRVHFYKHYNLAWKEPTKVLAKFTNGVPAVLEKTYGLGRVVLFNTSSNSEWSDLPKSELYLPLVQETIRYLKRERVASRPSYLIREPVELQFGPEFANEIVSIADADNHRTTIPLSNSGAGIFDASENPGIYWVHFDSKDIAPPARFAVNLNVRESNLSTWDEETVISWLTSSSKGTGEFTEAGFAAETGGKSREIWKILLGLVLVLVLFECWFANKVT